MVHASSITPTRWGRTLRFVGFAQLWQRQRHADVVVEVAARGMVPLALPGSLRMEAAIWDCGSAIAVRDATSGRSYRRRQVPAGAGKVARVSATSRLFRASLGQVLWPARRSRLACARKSASKSSALERDEEVAGP